MTEKNHHGLYPEFMVLRITQDQITKLHPSISHNQVMQVLDTYFEVARSIRSNRGLPNYTLDGSGCDL